MVNVFDQRALNPTPLHRGGKAVSIHLADSHCRFEASVVSIAQAVRNMDVSGAAAACRRHLEAGGDARAALDEGLRVGMTEAGVLFTQGTYFIPELLMCSDAFYAGLEVLKPHLASASSQKSGRILLGVVENDIHDIGKNIVKTMMECGGFEVVDLGRSVPARVFVEKARELDADVIALSTLMTTTMSEMAKVVEILRTTGIRERFKVIVGGSPVDDAFARKIGADGYAADAHQAVRLLRTLLGCES